MHIFLPFLLCVYVCSILCVAFTFINPPPGSSNLVLQIGGNFLIAWLDATGLVTLALVDGKEGNVAPRSFGTIQGSITGTVYPWNPPSDIAIGTYAIRATDNAGIYYSSSFLLSNGTASKGSSSAALSTLTTVTTKVSSSSTAAASTKTLSSSSILLISSSISESTSTPPSKSTVSTSSQATPTNIASLNTTDPAIQSNTGLNTGAKAGIGVGAAVAAILLFTGIALFFFKRGKKAEAFKRDSTALSAGAPVIFEKAVLGGNGRNIGTGVDPGTDREIIVDRTRFSELEGLEVPRFAELPGAGRS